MFQRCSLLQVSLLLLAVAPWTCDGWMSGNNHAPAQRSYPMRRSSDVKIQEFKHAAQSSQLQQQHGQHEHDELQVAASRMDRRSSLMRMLTITASSVALASAPSMASAKSYSSNARNLERLNNGDASGGSTYDNDPTSAPARRRRAMTGCKVPSAREEAAQRVLNLQSGMSEMDCNRRVMDGESDFMLKALQNLDCPSCPYGINPKRS
mmetsp:Transcript_5878/g.15938  ORF Transcript_5878/g.15938 Transcript_5878/m.15938 type:complete len:208 (-) Transcript_5878:1308-1931(-)